MDTPALNLRVESFLEGNAGRLLAAGIALFVGTRGFFLYAKPAWFDELITYYVTRTYSWSEMFQAVKLAVDAQPPTYHFLQAPALLLLGDDPRELRWVTLLAAGVALAATFVWLRRSTGAPAALAGVAMLTSTTLSYYALEARPYALLVGATSLALASRGLGWRIFWLTVVVSLHYFGAFVPLALAATESNWRRSAAILPALTPLGLTIPAAWHSAESLSAGPDYIPRVIQLFTTLPLLAEWSLYVLAALLLLSLIRWRGTDQPAKPSFDARIWAMIAIAPLCWAACYLFTDIFVSRYAIVSILGLAGLVAGLVHWLPYRGLVSAGVCVACLAASGASNLARSWDARPTAHLVDASIAASPLPVVMGSHEYLDVFHYLEPGHRKAFHRLTSQSSRTDAALGKHAGFPVRLGEPWLAEHSTFLVLAKDEGDWILEACQQRGATLRSVSSNASYRLYRVRMPGAGVSAAESTR